MSGFSALMDELSADPAVSAGTMFGHAGACLGRKFFANDFEGDLVVKLGAERVDELIAAGRASAFEPVASHLDEDDRLTVTDD
jgi:hypothetical protein